MILISSESMQEILTQSSKPPRKKVSSNCATGRVSKSHTNKKSIKNVDSHVNLQVGHYPVSKTTDLILVEI